MFSIHEADPCQSRLLLAYGPRMLVRGSIEDTLNVNAGGTPFALHMWCSQRLINLNPDP